MDIKVSVDVSEAMAGLADLQKRQIPFAMAKTLTGCAKAGQKAVQADMAGKFTLRNTFTQEGIRIKPANKNSTSITAVRFNLVMPPSSPLPSMVYSDFRVSTI